MAALECDGSGNISVQEIVDGINLNGVRNGPWDGSYPYVVGDLSYNATDEFYYSALVDNVGSFPTTENANWMRLSPVSYIDEDISRTVGVGGDYETLTEALTNIAKYKAINNATVTLTVLICHIISTPVSIYDTDFGNLHVVAESGTFDIDISLITSSSFINISNTRRITFYGDLNIYGDFTNTTSLTHPAVFNCDGSEVSFFSDIINATDSSSGFISTIFRNGIINVRPRNNTRVAISVSNFGCLEISCSGLFDRCDVTGEFTYVIFYSTDISALRLADCTVRSLSATKSVFCRENGTISLTGQLSDFRKNSCVASSVDINVSSGATITTYNIDAGIIGGTNITKNTLTASGIIFIS